MNRRSKPIVVPGFSLMPAPPQSEPPMWPGQASAKSSSSSSRLSEPKSSRAPSSGSTARSGRATSPTKSESPVTTSQGSSPRAASEITYAVCSGRWPGVASASMRTPPTVTAVAVRHRLVLEGDSGPSRHVNDRAGRLLQAPLAGDVIRVVVGLEDVRDPEAVLVREREIVLDVPLGSMTAASPPSATR